MATTTYSWTTTTESFFVNNLETTGDQAAPAIGSLTKGGYFTGWDSPSPESVRGRLFGADGTPFGDEFVANSTTAGVQGDASIAGILNGRSVVAFTDFGADPGGDIRARMFKANGTPVDLDFGVAIGGNDDTDADVAALASGGFAVAWTRNFGGDDNDLRVTVYRANGSVRASTVPVEVGVALNSNSASVAGLADGTFVVCWEEEPTAGGDTEVRFKRFAANGAPLDGSSILIDTFGATNEDIQVAALKDGGFAVAYTDSGWGDALDITVLFFNADGSARSDYLLANEVVVGVQNAPTITVLSNGYVVVGWSDGANLTYQAYDPDGNAIGSNNSFVTSIVEAELAGLGGGLLANVRSSTFTEPGGTGASIRSSIDELLRTITGDGTNETLSGDNLRDSIFGEGGKDKLFGFNGKDTLNGGDGADVLRGGNDRDVLTGAAGADRFAYNDVLQSRPLGALRDTIRDFTNGSDLIDVEAIDADTGTGGDQAFVYIGGLAFSAAGQIRGFQSGDDVVLQFSTDADGAAEMELLLKDVNLAVVDGADFVV